MKKLESFGYKLGLENEIRDLDVQSIRNAMGCRGYSTALSKIESIFEKCNEEVPEIVNKLREDINIESESNLRGIVEGFLSQIHNGSVERCKIKNS